MSSINGIGTVYFGRSAAGRDGSYVTTKWLSIVVPVVPLGSYRVLPTSQQNGYFPVFYSSTQFAAQSVPLHWGQVLRVYLTYVAFVVFLYLCDLLTGTNAGRIALHPVLAAFIAAVFSVLAVKTTSPIRKVGMLTNFIVLPALITLSLLLASGTSKMPYQSWNYMYGFWAAYALFALFTSGDSANKETRGRGARGR